jgi:precorrin-6A/cobalt-precorrin-6A reductase
LHVTLSLAGRTVSPAAQAVPVRRGGFGGIQGLAKYLREEHVDALIDATHPYAAIISPNAATAAELTNTPILVLSRPPWRAVEADRWIEVADAADAVKALGERPRTVFLAVGRQELTPFTAAPQHRYVVRTVDPVDPPLAVPHASYICARGPFTEEEDLALLSSHAIDAIVAKNSGGVATYSKMAAARALGIEVLLFRRPPATQTPAVSTVADAVGWLDHALGLDVPRGV